MLWVVENPSRFLHEKASIEGLAAEVEWLKGLNWKLNNDGLLQLDVSISFAQKTFDVELVYPHLFPDTPAFVKPKDGTTSRWSSHQYGAGGVLCLEWGPDTWNTNVTGADLLRSTYKLLSTEHAPEESKGSAVPSRHSVTIGQEIRASLFRLLVNRMLGTFIANLSEGASVRLLMRRVFHEDSVVFFASGSAPGEVSTFKNVDVPAGLWELGSIFSWESPGWIFKSTSFSMPTKFKDIKDVLAAIHGAGFKEFAFPQNEEKPASGFIVIFIGNSKMQAFLLNPHSDGSIKECVLLDTTVLDAATRLPQEHQNLGAKRVGIVGLGSVGSKIAVSLARSGVRRFLLVDDDVMLPANVCRHDLLWTAVGANKVDAVKEALMLVGPGMDIQCRRTRVAGQESSMSASTAAEALAACDLIVDATANSSVFVLLAAIAKRRSKPLVWGELFAGGIGAILARSRPGIDLDPLTTRASLYRSLENLPPAPFLREHNYDVTSEEKPIIASDSDVGQLAASMTRFCLDIMLNDEVSEFPHSVYLLGYKKAWVFEAPFDTRPLVFDTSVRILIKSAAFLFPRATG